MPTTDLEAIKARLAAATPGPWERGDRWHVQGASHCTCAPRYGPLIHEGRMSINGTMMQAHVHQAESPWHPYGIYGAPSAKSRWHPAAVVIETDEYGLMDGTDADLIAHAPEDLAALVAEVERLRGDLRATRTALDEALREADQEAAEQRTEVERLRAVAEAVTDFRQRTANMSVVSYDRASEAWHRVIAALDAWRGGEG